MRLKIIALIILGVGLLSGTIGYFVLSNKKPVDNIVSNGCLKDNEYVEYSLNKNDNSATILIRNKYSETDNFSFVIKDIRINYRPIEVHRCGVYTTRTFNYDGDKIAAGKWNEDFQVELWKYSYDGSGEKKILINEQVSKIYKRYYDQDFRVSPDEKYISLIQGRLGSDNHALVIRDIEAEENIFTLPIEKIIENNMDRIGTIGLKEWTRDGRYFWFDLFNAAQVSAFVRIERDTWNWEFLPAPENAMGGDALNYENGWVTHNTLSVWTGLKQLSDQIREEYQKEGKTGVLAIYNLFTKEQIILEIITDPSYSIKRNWISDTELEYYLQDGTRKVYTIQ